MSAYGRQDVLFLLIAIAFICGAALGVCAVVVVQPRNEPCECAVIETGDWPRVDERMRRFSAR